MWYRKMTSEIKFHFTELHCNEEGLVDYLSYPNLVIEE